jgi:dipeptidyl aminopeptidase/acylaminoacyl peptidase
MSKLGRILLLLLAAPAVSLADEPAGKKVITHETLWMMKRVGAPNVSPDGKSVVFSLNEPSYETDKAVSDLWLVPTDGHAPPRRLTHTKAPEEGVAWSPDSRSIAFSTKREGDEQAQIYILDLAEGGEAHRVTELSTGARNPKWRPDGKAILFESTVYPGAADDEANKKAAADKKARKYNLRAYEHFPVRIWNEWLDERQPSIFVQSLEPGAKPKDILNMTAFAQTSGFAGAPSGEVGFSLSPIWSPDGKEVVFNATLERNDSASGHVSFRLYRIAAEGGSEPKLITATPGEYGNASFAPDGKSLYFKYAPQDQEIYHLMKLQRMAWPAAGAMTAVTPDFDREESRYAFTPDSKTIYFLAPEAAKENLYEVSADGGKPTKVIEPQFGGYTALEIPEKAGKTIVVGSYGTSVRPAEIVRIDPSKKSHGNLTDFNGALADSIDWQPPQHFYFSSAKGRNIHNLLVLPPAFDANKKYPMLVLIHGGAASTNPDQIGLRWNYHLLASPGYVILMTDYTGSTGFGEKFSQAIKLDPLKTPGDEINQAVDEALKRYPFIDESRMCAGGASYGGHLANWIEATTTRYKCIVSHAGEVDLATQWGESDYNYEREVTNGGPSWEGNPIWREQSPITYAANWKTPMLLSIGERDFRVPLGNTLENWAALQHQKVPSRLLVWPDAWHWITKPEDSRKFYQEVHAWLANYLGPKGDKAAAN